MSYNETIDNYLYDEENEYTQANDLWEDFFMEKQDEIDERPWIQADTLVLRNELNKQVGDISDHNLSVIPARLELATFCSGGRRSIH